MGVGRTSIKIDGLVYPIGDPRSKNYKKGYAYPIEIDGKKKYCVYKGKWERVKEHEKGLYLKNGEYFFNEDSIDSKIELLNDKDKLFKEIKKNKKNIEERQKNIEEEIPEEELNIFLPEINDDDIILVKIVKQILLEKRIDLKTLKFNDMQELNNFKRGLKIHKTMSYEKFLRWMDLLDYDINIDYNPRN